uniref:Uncharacterized protein n=1 Tax=Knipowitschia caucasica TaxID=637954 RepID=A0AAV2LP30_KNICA
MLLVVVAAHMWLGRQSRGRGGCGVGAGGSILLITASATARSKTPTRSGQDNFLDTLFEEKFSPLCSERTHERGNALSQTAFVSWCKRADVPPPLAHGKLVDSTAAEVL